MKQPSPTLRSFCEQLSSAALIIRRKVVDAETMASREGLRFPEALGFVLTNLEEDLDRLGILLDPAHLAEDNPGRPSSEAGTDPNPAQDGRTA